MGKQTLGRVSEILCEFAVERGNWTQVDGLTLQHAVEVLEFTPVLDEDMPPTLWRWSLYLICPHNVLGIR